jgi:hypothetical protein
LGIKPTDGIKIIFDEVTFNVYLYQITLKKFDIDTIASGEAALSA